jgi:DNA-binding NarL/FixJ family response regulator
VSGGHTAIRVVIADDQEVVRAGFAALLETRDDITVVGTAATGAMRSPWPPPTGPTSS